MNNIYKNFKTLFIALLLCLLGMTNLFAQYQGEGVIGAAFTVNDNGEKVMFSQGNLQYQASTNTWRFATNQWDYVGGSDGNGTVYENGLKCNNSLISQTYSGWIDLFGWATSGYNHGAVCYQPWSISQTNSGSDYYAYGQDTYHLYDQTGQADWGHNAISNGGNEENSGWRTLTNDDWGYLFNTRSTPSGIRYAKANVNNVNGVILLPDDWNTSYYSLNNTNSPDASFSSNTISTPQWETLEQHGAVFLPAAGYRSGTSISWGSFDGYYWSSSSHYLSNGAYSVYFGDSSLDLQRGFERQYGLSVRLVRVAQNFSFGINATPSPAECGAVSGAGAYPMGAECTLTATPSAGYAFAYWTTNGTVISTDASYTFTVTRSRNLVANFLSTDPIIFADPELKAVCVAPETGWDANGDGELSYAEAAAVTSIGTVFKGKNNIQSFNELQHFIFLPAIDERAFMGCTALAEITIPENVATIGDKAFVNCPALATVHFNAINCTSMSTVYNEENYSVFMSNQTTFPLANLTIGNKVKNIPDHAFRGCNQLQEVDIPAPVITVGEYAFHSCTNLATLTIGEGVCVIGDKAFWNCPNLQTVHFNAVCCERMYLVFNIGTNDNVTTPPIVTLTIGENVTTIPNTAFSGFYNVVGNLSLPISLTNIGAYAFRGCSGFTGNLTIPNSVTDIGYEAFGYCSGFTGSLTIGNSVTTIGAKAFGSCSGFTGSLIIPNSVTTIGDNAFYSCSGFTGSLTIGNSVTTIGADAFRYCSGFTGSLIIPNSVTTIGDCAFLGCEGFTGNLIIPNSVTTIGCSAFSMTGYAGGGLDMLFLGRNVSSIGVRAFNLCDFTVIVSEMIYLPEIILWNPWDEDDIWYNDSEDDLFLGNNHDIPVYVPAGRISAYQNANCWRNFTNYKSQVNFTQDSSGQWSDDFNWSSWEVPGTEDVVCITDDCQLDMDANVLYVYVADDEKVLTINNGKTLNATYGVHIENTSQLVIEDGAQLYNTLPGMQGTMQKHIDGYGTGNDGWYLIASPLAGSIAPETVGNIFSAPEYDLYRFNQSAAAEWENYKTHTNDFFFENGTGYLYASQAEVTLAFAGTLNHESSKEVTLSYDDNATFKGFNLVGNPFTCNAYLSNGEQYLEMNSDGSGFVLAESSIIPPMKGIFIEAAPDQDVVIFVTERPDSSGKSVTLRLNSNRGTNMDAVRVRMDGGKDMTKLVLNENAAKLYIPQNGKDYTVVNAPADNQMPVNFKTGTQGTYTLNVEIENASFGYLHLIDNLTGSDVDLLANPSYTFEAKPTDYAARFTLVFAESTGVEENTDAPFAFISNGNIIIPDADAEATVQIVDVTGRVIVSSDVARNVSTNGMTPGVYVVRLISGDNMKTQKVVVK